MNGFFFHRGMCCHTSIFIMLYDQSQNSFYFRISKSLC